MFKLAAEPKRWISETAPFGAERHQLVKAAFAAVQAQETMRQHAAFEEGIELFFDGLRQVGAGSGFGLGEEGRGLLLHQSVQRGLLRVSIAQSFACQWVALRRRQYSGGLGAGPIGGLRALRSGQQVSVQGREGTLQPLQPRGHPVSSLPTASARSTRTDPSGAHHPSSRPAPFRSGQPRARSGTAPAPAPPPGVRPAGRHAWPGPAAAPSATATRRRAANQRARRSHASG